MGFSFHELAIPIVGAPMVEGPSTPQLLTALACEGGFGFLPGGYLTPGQLETQLAATAGMTTGPIGVNLLIHQPNEIDIIAFDNYAARLALLARRYETSLGIPDFHSDDCWPEKYDLLLSLKPHVVSFTFGCPSPEQIRLLQHHHISVAITITTLEEARIGYESGADILIVQGPHAGWHRASFTPTFLPASMTLVELLDQLVYRYPQIEILAAGGISTPRDLQNIIHHGACAAMLGTGLLLASEAGTPSTYRAALQNPEFHQTVVTNVFTGRWGRTLENDFTHLMADHCPPAYPAIRHITTPLYVKAYEYDDPHAIPLWAGTGVSESQQGTTAEIISYFMNAI